MKEKKTSENVYPEQRKTKPQPFEKGEEDAIVDFNTVATKHLSESTKISIKEDARYTEKMIGTPRRSS